MPHPNDNLQVDASDTMTPEELIEAELAEAAGAGAGATDPDAEAAAAAAAETAAIEAEATRKGWRPKDKYEGDASKWVDAKTFIERGERFNKNLQKEVTVLKAKIESFEGTKAAFVKHQNEIMQRKDAELADALRQLRIQRSEAQADGDHEAAVALEDRIESVTSDRAKIKEELAAVEAPAAPTVDPVLEEWIGDGNDWFAKDAKLRNYAITLGDELRSQGESLKGRAFLDKISTLMAAEFPARFGNANRQRPGAAEGSRQSGAPASGGTKTERDLPAADRALMREFVAQGYITKEKFLKDYFSRNG